MADDEVTRIQRAQADLAHMKGELAFVNQSIGALQHDLESNKKQLALLSLGVVMLCALVLIQSGVLDRE